MQCYCDKCNKEFEIKPQKKFVALVGKKWECQYFTCPHCKAEYIIQFADKGVKEKIKKRDKLFKKLSNLNITDEQKKSLVDKIEKIKSELLVIQRELKEIYLKGD